MQLFIYKHHNHLQFSHITTKKLERHTEGKKGKKIMLN